MFKKTVSDMYGLDDALLYIRFYKLMEVIQKKKLLTEEELEYIFEEPKVIRDELDYGRQ